MVKREMKKIFLSASIPSPEREKEFYETADIIAIRDSIIALTTEIIPEAQLIWGGHPAITPLIRHVIDKMRCDLKSHVTLYQSEFFEEFFPEDNFSFENMIVTQKMENRDNSLLEMRKKMIGGNNYVAGIFIGGMEGVIDEYNMFKKSHPNALIFPIASTGAAAKKIYEQMKPQPETRLKDDYAYMALFNDILKDKLRSN